MDRSVPLNANQAHMLHRMFHEEPVIKCCTAKLMHAIFSGGMALNGGTEGPEATPAFAAHMDNAWIPFGCDVLINFILWGFCPYIINKRRHPKTRRIIRYPVALEFGTYEVRFEIDANYEKTAKVYQLNYANQPLDMRKPDARVKLCYYNNATRPTMLGHITTGLGSIASTVAHVDELNEYALRAESIRAHPTVFVESTPDSRKFEEVQHLHAFEGPELIEARTQRQTSKTYHKYEAVMASVAMGSEAQGREIGTSRTTGKRFRTHKAIWENNIFCVPDGTVLSSNTPQAEARPDLLQLNMHKEDLICAVLGVPKTMMFSDVQRGAGAGSSTDQVRDSTFRRTVDSYKEHIVRVMNDVYQAIYKTDEDVVTVPGTPLNSMEDILAVYDRGIINGDTMARYLMRSMNASDLDIDSKRVKKFDAHHVKTMMANECPTDPSAGVPKPEPKPPARAI